jgi:AsmA protein
MKTWFRRSLWIALAAVVMVGIAAPYLDADFFRPAIQRALERGLARRVEVKKVYFNLFTGPGFTLDGVTIYEDPRAGIEPFAYVGALEARVRLLSLFARRLEFSSLRLHEGPAPDDETTSINLVKTAAGPWNFQFLLSSAPAISGAMPSIKIRKCRVNFKFADTKSVFYFADADFDVAPSLDGSVELRFSGAPSRTDRAAQNFGHFFVRGNWAGQHLDMKVELERSGLDEVARLIDRRDLGVHGIVALNAQLSGSPAHLDVTGELQIDDVHRWDLLPKRGGGWRIPYKGTLDLRGERLELASAFDAPKPPLSLEFRAWDFLSAPQWDAAAELKQMPLGTLVEVVRHMGSAVPEKVVADGSVSGAVRYSQQTGFAGRVELQDASLTLPEGQPLRAASAAVAIEGNALLLEPSSVSIGDHQSAEVEGGFDPGGGLSLKIVTRGLNVADLRSFGLSAIPLLEQTPQGTFRGWTAYEWKPDEVGQWSGEYDLQNARIAIDGLADPVRIQSAAVVSAGPRVSVTRLRARVGAIAFTGDYRYEPAAARPHKFHIQIPHAEAGELERIFEPALVRERGFLARTLRLGAEPAPDWLKNRRADGTLSIGTLVFAGDTEAHLEGARVLWDGAFLRLVRVDATVDPAVFNGELALDLSGRAPHFRFEGKLRDVAYKGGSVDFEGSLDADGAGVELLNSARAEGCLHARSIAFAPDAEFRAAKGCFEMSTTPAGLRWKFPGIEVLQGSDAFYGTGTTQPDGRLVLDLTNRGRQVRYTSAIASLSQSQQ